MPEVLIISAVIFGFALVSKRLAMSPITGPMVFTTVGLLVGSAGVGWFGTSLDGEALSIIVETTLVLVLFTDAIRINVSALRKDVSIPIRLLGVGLPLTLTAGTVAAAVVFPGLSWAEALLLAAVLTPTDAALGQSVVSDTRLPARVRQSLNVESGLNDGIMVPVVTVAIALAVSEEGGSQAWVAFAGQQIGFGVICGVTAGALGGLVLDRFAAAGRIEGAYRQLATVAIAAFAYASAQILGGNGFVAAFAAGLVFGIVARRQCSDVQDFTQDEGDLLTAITFILFGAVIAGPLVSEMSWAIALYVVLSLSVVRMVPVALALIGSGTLGQTRLFLGWFGPRGLASILFALLVMEEVDGPGAQMIFTVATWTVLVSVYAHGVSAGPWAARLGARLAALSDSQPENLPTPAHPTRRRLP
ncbi:MAG: cation:proton antiporter [Ornithinimicrobium sp.]